MRSLATLFATNSSAEALDSDNFDSDDNYRDNDNDNDNSRSSKHAAEAGSGCNFKILTTKSTPTSPKLAPRLQSSLPLVPRSRNSLQPTIIHQVSPSSTRLTSLPTTSTVKAFANATYTFFNLPNMMTMMAPRRDLQQVTLTSKVYNKGA